MTHEVVAAVAIGSMIFTFAYLAVNIDKKHGALQFFFIMFSMFSMVWGQAFLIESYNVDVPTESTLISILNSFYSILIWVPVIVAFYFIIVFIWNIFAKKKAGQD